MKTAVILAAVAAIAQASVVRRGGAAYIQMGDSCVCAGSDSTSKWWGVTMGSCDTALEFTYDGT